MLSCPPCPGWFRSKHRKSAWSAGVASAARAMSSMYRTDLMSPSVGFAARHAAGSSRAHPSGAAWTWTTVAGSSARSTISADRGESPSTDMASSRPSRADTLVFSPFTRSRPLGGNKPISSHTAMSNPLECPAERSADRKSTCPHLETAMRGTLPQRMPASPLDSDMSRTCCHNSAALSRDMDATPERQPRRRSGPSSARCASSRMAMPPDLLFFLPQNRPASRIPGFKASVRKSSIYAGMRIGLPALRCPGGTIKRCSDHSATAAAGSFGGTGSGAGSPAFSARTAARLDLAHSR